MIFRQIPQILRGQKTQTRRVALPEPDGTDTYPCEMLAYPMGVLAVQSSKPGQMGWHTKWQVGRTYAVVPKRGMRTVMHFGRQWESPHSRFIGEQYWSADARHLFLEKLHWQPLRIRITAIRREKLQDITEADARAEGVESVEAYRALWDSINGKTKSARWDGNPDVWVLTFELVPR